MPYAKYTSPSSVSARSFCQNFRLKTLYLTLCAFFLPVSFIAQASESGNTVNITTNQPGDVFGGGSPTYTGDVTHNTVNMQNGTVSGNIYGGASNTGNVTGNAINMQNGTVNGHLFGGLSVKSDSVHNTITITGGTVKQNLVGGWAQNTGNATDNVINMKNGNAGKNIYGGLSHAGNATGNVVNLQNGKVSEKIFGGLSVNANAADNTVTLTNAAVNLDVIGGWAQSTGNATGNTINIQNSTIGGNIFGGLSSNGHAINNTINLYGGTISGGVYGGQTLGATDQRSGNTLNVRGFQGTLAEVNNFAYYSFLLPASLQNGDTLIRIIGASPTDLTGTSTSLNIATRGVALAPGFTVVLIDKAVNTPDTTSVTAKQGISLLYDFTLGVDASNRFIGTLNKVQVNPQTKALSEGRIAGLAMVNQGTDLFLKSGLQNAYTATEKEERAMVFSAVSGESLHYNSGSYVDINSFSMLAGGAIRNNNLLLGAFFEAGWGDYDSYNSFTNAASVKGDGSTNSYGAGAFARYKWNVDKENGLYMDVSLRVGRVKTDFNSTDLTNTDGQSANYDLNVLYYGGHAGLGYEWNISEAVMLDASSRYLWTHQNGKSVTILGDSIEFKDIDSRRWRNGVRLNYTKSNTFVPYAGAYYEQEFSATAKASTYGFDIATPKLKGGTGIAELGLTLQPTNFKNVSLNFALQGYTGKREGLSGHAGMKWTF